MSLAYPPTDIRPAHERGAAATRVDAIATTFPITWGCLPAEASSAAVMTAANTYRIQSRYSEDTFVTHNWDGRGSRVEAVGCPWHLARALSQHLPEYRSVGVGVFLSCEDAFILQRRAQWVTQPGSINIIGESASVEDIANKELHLTNTALRGVREELGVTLEKQDVTFFSIAATQATVAAFAYAHIPMPFASVMDCWQQASHHDEGVPVRMDCAGAMEALRWRYSESVIRGGLFDCTPKAA